MDSTEAVYQALKEAGNQGRPDETPGMHRHPYAYEPVLLPLSH